MKERLNNQEHQSPGGVRAAIVCADRSRTNEGLSFKKIQGPIPVLEESIHFLFKVKPLINLC